MFHDGDTKAGRIFNRLNDFPSLPKVVEKLLALPEAGVSTRDFADLIALDQGLVAKVLRLVNSAFYSLRAPISSIRLASSVLGVRTLKSLALSASVIHAHKRPHPHFDPVQSWRHALAVALGARKIAERLKLPLEDEVYAAGLLHDIGVGLLLQHYPAEYAAVTRGGPEGTPQTLAQEAERFGQTHAELAYHMANQWRFPPLIAQGLRYHHTPPGELPADLDAQARRLIEVVQLADGYARRSGYSLAEVDRLEPDLPLPQPVELDLSPAEVAELLEGLRPVLAELESTFFQREAEPVKA